MRTWFIGTAGWTLGRGVPTVLQGEGSHLQRYARVFNAVEVNSTFYRLPMARTLERWSREVPDGFRFAVKMPKAITHERRLTNVDTLLKGFIERVHALGSTCGPVLVQLPPSLVFSAAAEEALHQLRERFAGGIVCEPRHASWSAPEVEGLLRRLHIARVVADPPRGNDGYVPGGDTALAYFRLHGTPRIYWSAYTEAELRVWAERIAASRAKDVWVMFDNTAEGHAIPNALRLQALLNAPRSGRAARSRA